MSAPFGSSTNCDWTRRHASEKRLAFTYITEVHDPRQGVEHLTIAEKIDRERVAREPNNAVAKLDLALGQDAQEPAGFLSFAERGDLVADDVGDDVAQRDAAVAAAVVEVGRQRHREVREERAAGAEGFAGDGEHLLFVSRCLWPVVRVCHARRSYSADTAVASATSREAAFLIPSLTRLFWST